jgi:ABC-type sugar transport system ATPase subunit
VVLISHDIAGVVEVADRIHIHRLGRCPGVADDVGAELLVVGIHHRSAVGKVLRGSNAQCIPAQRRLPVPAVRAHGSG